MTTKEMIAVMQAYEDGKEIERRRLGSNSWTRWEGPVGDWLDYDYRIKPGPKYVPYKALGQESPRF